MIIFIYLNLIEFPFIINTLTSKRMSLMMDFTSSAYFCNSYKTALRAVMKSFYLNI